MSHPEIEKVMTEAFSAMGDRKNSVELSLHLKPDHAIEILRLLEKLQNG